VIGFDWIHYFGRGFVAKIYPPWGNVVVQLLTWERLVGFSLAAVTLAVFRRAVSPVSAVCALFAMPVLWTLFLGQLEGLITLGLLALPWLAPLALLKPQISTFAFGARFAHIVCFFALIAVSLLIWPGWITSMLGVRSYYGEGRLTTDISLNGWGIPLALVLFWFSRGDMDMLMAAGTTATLHLIPYNLTPVAPAIARLKPVAAVIAAALSWLPVLANWIGPGGWWLEWFFIAFLWLCLAAKRYPRLGANQRWRRWLIDP
jgi:hypothetical protein